MYFIHCTAHKVELAVLDSIKSDTNLEKLQSTLSAIFLYYCYSQKKHREIQEISSFLNETFWQFSGLKNNFWLTSRDSALSITEFSYSTIVINQGKIAESNDKNAATAKGHVMGMELLRAAMMFSKL